jgi:geranylgeranyl pyrophosphate synthase
MKKKQQKELYQAFGVNSHIKKFVRDNIRLASTLSFLNVDIVQAVDIVSPGRERAYLMKLASELSGIDSMAVDLLAVVIEMQIIAAYVKDDILDNNYVRCNQRTPNYKYGIKNATVFSDLFLNSSYLALEKVRPLITETQYREIVLKINESYQCISLGQIETTCFDYSKPNLISAICALYDRLVGVAYGNYCSMLVCSDDILKEQLSLFGKNIGVALQVKNDISDFIIDPLISGIPAYQDLLQGHPNIVIAYLLEYKKNFSQKEIDLLSTLLSGHYKEKGLLANDEDIIITMLEKSEAISKSLIYYNKLLDNCLNYISFIQDIKVRKNYMNFLKTLIYE